MLKPIELYENPSAYWHLITAPSDMDFEDQHFDRKEAGRPDAAGHLPSGNLTEIISQAKETISAFANANRDGGLLVIGVSTAGEIKGLSHLNDTQRNNLLDCQSWLTNHNSKCRLHDCTGPSGPTKVALIFTPHLANGICETPDKDKRAWLRQGAQNVLLNADQKDALRRDKGITVFENEKCCEFKKNDLDAALLSKVTQRLFNFGAFDEATNK